MMPLAKAPPQQPAPPNAAAALERVAAAAALTVGATRRRDGEGLRLGYQALVQALAVVSIEHGLDPQARVDVASEAKRLDAEHEQARRDALDAAQQARKAANGFHRRAQAAEGEKARLEARCGRLQARLAEAEEDASELMAHLEGMVCGFEGQPLPADACQSFRMGHESGALFVELARALAESRQRAERAEANADLFRAQRDNARSAHSSLSEQLKQTLQEVERLTKLCEEMHRGAQTHAERAETVTGWHAALGRDYRALKAECDELKKQVDAALAAARTPTLVHSSLTDAGKQAAKSIAIAEAERDIARAELAYLQAVTRISQSTSLVKIAEARAVADEASGEIAKATQRLEAARRGV